MEAYLVRLGEVAERGYAVNYGETSLEEVGISAPALDHRGELVGAVLVSAPRFRVAADQVPVIGEAVAEAAAAVTARLGGAPAG